VEFNRIVFGGFGYGTYGWTGLQCYAFTSYCLI